MRRGEFKEGECVLRAKIDMASPNMNMRDPVLYRIIHTPHHNTGGAWCIYPMYDFAHPLEDALEHITQAGATAVFLPAYSPDLNPIEKMWSKLKALLRAAEPRTWDDLIPSIAAALAKVTAKDALGWFTSCGYSFI